jgi:hypothetical protein
MNERDRRLATRQHDLAHPPSAVRVIGASSSLATSSDAGPASNPEVAGRPSVMRPEHFDQLTDVVDQLRSGRVIRLTLDGFVDGAERRRAFSFLRGAAYALDIETETGGPHDDTIVLDPCAPETPPPRTGAERQDVRREATCALCDLRVADREFEPPLEMVLKRDGSRIWSPPAMVCSHCRTTIRHWRFALAWCSQCERWGRRNVVSPCGELFG